MSWFKRTSSVREDGRMAVNGRSTFAQNSREGSCDRASTDPETCFEVFKNHWQQAVHVIGAGSKKSCSNDDVETVVHNFEQMITLMVGEDGIDGMPGPILHFLLEKEVLDTFCNWCSSQREYQDKLCMEQLRMYELLISQSRQLLLIHRQIIRPLLRLLMACAELQLPNSGSEEFEFRLVLVLHQICTCISQETVILESFFSTEADHGPAKFLIFSLLITYIHREGPIGQRARDALLLLMTLSAIHPHIGRYIAENSDFCPVLATGLSGLYSSLPRKITPPSEDWFALTEEDCQRIVDLQMFLNSLEFCNAVVQVVHPLVRDQLIKFIYTGFLLPVLGPALHQDISGLPIPLLDTAMFMNSRDEVMTATAYLDLFLRKISEPHLIRAFLRFVLTERHDEMLILDSLITRINSNTKLSLVSLSLFHTLIDMNCEEVMLQLVFKYLIPCTHVMVSQRRAVRDLDLYGKSAEKFLSLRPVCCMTYPTPNSALQGPDHTPSGTHSPLVVGRTQSLSRTMASRSASVRTPAELVQMPVRQEPRRRNIFGSKKEKPKLESCLENEQKQVGDGTSSTAADLMATCTEDANIFSESSYMDYLLQARSALERCGRACRSWSAPYDGERPPPDSFLDHLAASSASVANNNSATELDSVNEKLVTSDDTVSKSDGSVDSADIKKHDHSTVKLLSHGNVSDTANMQLPDSATLEQQARNPSGCERPSSNYSSSVSDSASLLQNSTISSSVINKTQCNKDLTPSTTPSACLASATWQTLDIAKLRTCLGDLDSFLAYLNEVALSAEESTSTVEESVTSLDSVLNSLSVQKKISAARSGSSTRTSSLEREVSGMMPQSDPQTVSASSTNSQISGISTATKPATTSQVVRHSAPPKTLGLALAKDVSVGGKFQLLSPLRTPDDMSRAFVMSPTSPGFLLSSSSFSSSSSVLRPIPAALRYSSSPPNIGPFLAAVFGRLEGMIQNSLYANLLLTGLVSRLAAYPHPLLRSFLLNVNLVFQPSVKSLVQVLSSVRQKVDSYAVTTRNFSSLIPKARRNLKMKEDSLLFPSQALSTADYLAGQLGKPRAATMSDLPLTSEKRKVSLADLFRRSPKQHQSQPRSGRGRAQQLQRVQIAGGVGYRYINSQQQSPQEGSEESLKTWNAIYCALVLEEFLKELAALSMEHSVLNYDEGYASS